MIVFTVSINEWMTIHKAEPTLDASLSRFAVQGDSSNIGLRILYRYW